MKTLEIEEFLMIYKSSVCYNLSSDRSAKFRDPSLGLLIFHQRIICLVFMFFIIWVIRVSVPKSHHFSHA